VCAKSGEMEKGKLKRGYTKQGNPAKCSRGE